MKFFLSFYFLYFSFVLNASEMRGYTVGQVKAQTPILKESPRSFGSIVVENINRLNYLGKSNKIQFEVGLELNQVFQWVHDPLQERDFNKKNTAYRLEDFTPITGKSNSDISSYYLLKQLDRLQVHYSFLSYDITFGRQQISFGSAKLINPTDVFGAFSPTTINTEEKNGVDALRLKKAYGPNSELEIGVLFGNKFKAKNSAVFLRSIFSYKELEIKPIVMSYREAYGIGLDLLVPYRGALLYLESLSTIIDKKEYHSYNRTTVGLEYQLGSDFFVILEYHYNGDGREKASEYDLTASSFSLERGANFYLGRHYFNAFINYQLTPLHLLSITTFQNLTDHSNLLSPRWIWSFGENSTIETGLFLGLGKNTNIPLQSRSEFGSYGHQVFSKVTYYF